MINKIDVEIDGVEYTLPKEITVSHYGEVMRRMSFSDDDMDKAFDIIGVLLNIPYNLLRELDPDKIADLSIFLQNKMNQCDVPYIQSFKYKGTEYGGIVLNKMTFGEYVDIVNYIKDEVSIYMNIHKLCSLLYRPIVNKKVIPYDLEQQELQYELFKDLPAKYFFGAFKNLYIYLTQMKKEFVVLFGDDEDRRTIEGEIDKPKDDGSNLPWYKMIMALTGDDFTKIEYVVSRPVVECFNHLTYIRIRNEEERKKYLDEKNKMNVI